MTFLFVIFTIFIIGLFIVLFFAIRYRNPYKLYMVFGKKGSGKTTFMTALAFKYLKAGRKVYCTVRIPGTYYFSADLVGKVEFPAESVILIDEVGMIWDNRDFKNFRTDVRDFFKLQRHYKNIIWLFSQTWDIDIKLRTLCDDLYLMINYFGVLSVAKQIKRKITVVKPSENSESRIADELVITPFILFPFGARKWLWIPKYAKYFDSFEAPKLAQNSFTLIDFPEGHIPRFLKKKDRRRLKNVQVIAEKTERKAVKRRIKKQPAKRNKANGDRDEG